MKLEVPRFDGFDALGWIFKISQFFDFHQTPNHDRLTIASFYMDGPALGWFQWMMKNGLIHAWPDFLMALETRFATTTLVVHYSNLHNAVQSTNTLLNLSV
jgi:hypothetical protein